MHQIHIILLVPVVIQHGWDRPKEKNQRCISFQHSSDTHLPPWQAPSVNGGSDALPLRQSLRSLSVYGSGDPCGGCLGHEALGTGILPSGPEQDLNEPMGIGI